MGINFCHEKLLIVSYSNLIMEEKEIKKFFEREQKNI